MQKSGCKKADASVAAMAAAQDTAAHETEAGREEEDDADTDENEFCG